MRVRRARPEMNAARSASIVSLNPTSSARRRHAIGTQRPEFLAASGGLRIMATPRAGVTLMAEW